MHMQPMPGKRRLGRYEMYELLGAGGMSEVYAGMHLGLQKRVAIKVLRAGLRDDPAAIERFLREGECAARVSHPNVVDVDDVGLEGGVPYLAMELLTGETLEERLKRKGPMSVRGALEILLPLVDAAAAIHVAGVIHRDIKPANVVLAFDSEGKICPKLVDFGVATVVESRAITGAIGSIGTPQYMSPEQAHGTRVLDPATDQYSLASMLFEMLTGSAPFQHQHVRELLRAVARGDFPRLVEHVAGLPEGFYQVLARATSRDPRSRYASVSEFGRALRPYASAEMRARIAQREHTRQALSSEPEERVSPTVSGLRPSRPKSALLAHWELATLLVAGLAMSAGLALGAARGNAAEPALPETPRTPLALAQPTQRPRASPLRTLHLLPAHAEALVDGLPVGTGDVQLTPFVDDTIHELRVRAAGHVTRVVLFRGNVDETQIVLARLD